MSHAAGSSPAHPLEMIEAMTRCAYELGVAASDIAKRATGDTARFPAASAEFRHCFFAVRMGIRLTLAQRTATGAVGAAAPAERLERERSDAADQPERDESREPPSCEPGEAEREREGDYEPVSLPQFLKTLGLAAARADERRDELPAHVRDTTLPVLKGLLRQAKAPPDGGRAGGGAALAVLARPPVAPAGRSRLLTSTGAIGVPPLVSTAARRRDSS